MQPETKKHHVTSPGTFPPTTVNTPQPNSDFKIPPPHALEAQPGSNTATLSSAAAAPTSPTSIYYSPVAMSSTQIVIAFVTVVVWAGLLLFIRRLLTQSLISQFADLGRSRAVGTALYVFLLVLGACIVVCALGNFWSVMIIVIPAVLLNLVLMTIFLVSLGSARASRQRR